MLDDYDKKILRNYLNKILSDNQMTHKMYSEICDWLEDHLESIVTTEISEDVWEAIGNYSCAIREHRQVLPTQKKFLTAISQLLVANKDDKIPPNQLEVKLAALTSAMKLDENDRTIFNLIARYNTSAILGNLLDRLGECGCPLLLIVSLATGLNKKTIAQRVNVNGVLVSSGLVQLKIHKGNNLDDYFDLPASISEALTSIYDTPDDCIRSYILGKPAQAELDWDDFAHLDEVRTTLFNFLNQSTQQGLKGINILLWGAPGGGKSEFCKTLANKMNCSLYAIGGSESNAKITHQERLNAVRLAQGLLQYQNNNLLMFEFDKTDDLSTLPDFFKGMMDSAITKQKLSSKEFPVRSLGDNPVPTLWVVDDASFLEESIISRMSLVLEIKSPPNSSLQKNWNQILAKHGLNLPDQAVAELKSLGTSTVVLDNAARFAKINGQGPDDILFAVRGVIKAVKGSIKPISATSYCSDLVNADMNLSALGAQLKKSGQRQFSLCLYGNPGTGKTEYVRQLAKQLGMEVLVKRASDLLDSLIGETEQRIAAAFREAQEKERFLIFDEADSLLGDRRHSQHRWEISQVNEMLTWMESHPLPFACTTNLMERLDQASLRRFTFKVGFSALTQAQNSLAFKQFFGVQAPKEIGTFSNLTPGDFAVVQKKAAIMGAFEQPEELIKMLKVESTVKSNDTNQIGFAMN